MRTVSLEPIRPVSSNHDLPAQLGIFATMHLLTQPFVHAHAGIYAISYQNLHHIIIRSDNMTAIDRALLAKGVSVEILSDEGVIRDTSRMYVYRRAMDDQGSLSEKLSGMINVRLRKFFGTFSADDVLTQAAILEATPKWRLIVSFCRRIGAREADLVQATKEYSTLQQDE